MTQFQTQVDARKYEPKDKHPVIFKTLESLKKGDVMELLNDHDPRPLRYQMEAEYPDQYGWEYLEEGPEVWRVAISKDN